ncbi:MAG: NAD(P)-dependent alcohol dehydrogenase [Polaromonas sp.]|nr:NAD(P)-dependent alcohol dehydrogenase [Polaromonas sp.]
MKAAICTQYGSPDVLQLKNVEKPIPKRDEVLIKVYVATVTSGDCRVRALNVPLGFNFIMRSVLGFSKPRQPILGSELAGVVEAIGKDVSKFKVGDAVFAFSDMAMGCYAEFKCISQNSAIALKPSNLSFEESAALSFGGTTTLSFLRRAKIQLNDKVLVIGASGCVGTAAVQLAKYFGAVVTGVCSTANIPLVKSLGARDVIDYTREDFGVNNEQYDIIIDAVGGAPFERYEASLKDGGRVLMLVAGLPDMLYAPWIAMTSNKKLIAGPVAFSADDIRFLADLAQAGNLISVIDKRFPFEQIVEAHRYVDTGRKKGNVVLMLTHSV